MKTIHQQNCRAMAICIALMFGRWGSVAGSNFVALLLDDHCESAFYLFGGTLIGDKHNFSQNM